jgi:hypothetical protein
VVCTSASVLSDQDRLARAFARRVGQHLPRLIGAAELEDADAISRMIGW